MCVLTSGMVCIVKRKITKNYLKKIKLWKPLKIQYACLFKRKITQSGVNSYHEVQISIRMVIYLYAACSALLGLVPFWYIEAA